MFVGDGADRSHRSTRNQRSRSSDQTCGFPPGDLGQDLGHCKTQSVRQPVDGSADRTQRFEELVRGENAGTGRRTQDQRDRLDQIIGSQNWNGSVPNEKIAALGGRSIDVPGNGQHLATLFEGAPGGDQSSPFSGSLDNHHGGRKP